MSEQIESPEPIEFPFIRGGCNLAHPKFVGIGANRSQIMSPCLLEARWIGYTHKCYRPNGQAMVFCQPFLDRLVNAEYPLKCGICGHIFTSFVDRVWDFHLLTNEPGNASENN